MSMNFNGVVRLGQDPELRTTGTGTTFATFSGCSQERWKSKDGERQEKAHWYDFVVWGSLGQIAATYLKKGSQVYICGKIKQNKWNDKNTGETRYKMSFDVNQLQFLDKKGDSPGSAAPNAVDTDDDIPF